MNRIVEVSLNGLLRIMISNYGSKQYHLPNGKNLRNLKPNSGLVIHMEVILCEILGMKETVNDFNDRVSRFTRRREVYLTLTDK